MRFLHKFEAFLEGLSNEQLQNLNEVAEQMMQTRSESSSDSTEKGTHGGNGNVAEDFKVTRTEKINDNRKTPVKFKKNEWEDTGESSDVETPNFEKTPRKRSKPNKRHVECHVCGREFSINENLIYGEFHRCNRCTGK
jgi:hypothetical protein